MITEFSLNNFKSFKHLDGFKINDLTIIAGKNSCGKSSILQSLLLLRQTLTGRGIEAIELDGEHLTYSNLKEIAYSLPPINRAKIKYSFEIKNKEETCYIDFSIVNRKYDNHYTPDVDHFRTRIVNEKGRSRTVNFFKPVLDDKKLSFLFPEKIIGQLASNVKISTSFLNFLPYSLSAELNLVSPKSGKKSKRVLPVPMQMIYPNEVPYLEEFNRFLREIKYLGPVRAAPKRAYVHFTEAATDLLPSGENAAHVLWARQDEIVSFEGKDERLIDALNKCIDIVGLSQVISPSRIGDLIYKINLSQKDCRGEVTISDVGFGYSQLIPIILLCLLSEKDDLIILEQPEIHLHPSSAANLADLFLRFIQDGRRVLIETHSSELISRLRLRVIESPKLKDKITISFVDADDVNNEGAKVRQFNIDEKGMFPVYPDGFLDESDKLAEAIIRARVKKNKEKKMAVVGKYDE
ncbi:AAA family ATPase [Kluyvera ascorbata]|uniref:AAA family ATPase n=1 Tax=Kluyvera ascorbata TaxID=51288 RepID=UPI0028DFC8DA|nr:AAA family ATPase [Kluyvera ascorbata]MDT8701739.1 AAA family ATPase [Kluyvera ascorbata]